MNNNILFNLQYIKKFKTKVNRGLPTGIFIILFVIFTFAFMGIVRANEQYKTTVVFDQTQNLPLALDNKQTEIQPGLAKADIDKLNIEHDPEAIKAYIREQAPKYGLDWKLVYAIGAYESGYYKSSLAQNNNNFFGRKETGTTWRKWNTAEEGIQDQLLYIKEHYVDNGLDTPAKMNHIYCEGNTWQYKVQAIMNSLA